LRQNFGDAVKGRVSRFEQRGLNYADQSQGYR
jgi:hypothetical protein